MTISSIMPPLKRVICLGFMAMVLCSILVLGWGSAATANNVAGRVVQSRAEQEFDRVAGSGTANQIKGRATQDLGRVQQQIDKTTSQNQGVAKQIQGKVQQDIGRTQSAFEDATDAVEDSTDGVVDSVKNFFGQ
ncbi:MAG: hypothetical protein HC929_14450 [Leptolyngbyaceae cyanobacterium SM2_5_2]|nr:hypothetical protein [Leptolyngbyaceae cyanobacterium SM2_5_2]